MATPAGQLRPWRLILTFVGLTAILYGLVFFTAGSNSPKLGIDLQGGTRITLTAQSSDNATPTRQSMQLARDIMERRVNGSGVAGAQVQIEGANQLVVTVPGTEDLTDLTRSAQLQLRPVLGACTTSAVYPNLGVALPSPSASVGAPGTTDTETTGTGSSAPATDATAPATDPTAPATDPTAAPTTDASATSQGLRAPNVAQAARTTDPSVGASDPAATDAAATDTAGTATAGTDTAGTATSGTDTTGTAAAGTDTPGTATGTAAPTATFPASSDQKVPTQPASTLQADWTTWETDIATAISGGLSCTQINAYAGLDDPTKPLVSCLEDSSRIYVLEPTLIPGDQVDNATSGYDSSSGWAVSVNFKSDGASKWAAYTTQNATAQKAVAFVLDGEVITAPTIQSAITTATQITGSFTQATASGLANSLKLGALPLAFERSSSNSVTAELGLSYLRAGLIAGGIGLLLVVVYCLVYYRLLGVITILSLVLSFGLIYAVMVLLGRWINLSLDMSGIAGLIIAIGITADSFVVYFERIKDEVREGRTFRSAVPRGWVRAKRTILSADAVSFLAAAILYVLAVGDVKGFAFTLGLSTVLDLVVVFLVTHPLVALASGNKIFSSPTWSGLGSVADAGQEQRSAASSFVKEAVKR
ncbi:MAG: protein translocase subunit SecD [Nakamurella sp.]